MYDEFLKTDFVRLFFLIHFFRLRYEKNGKNKGTILPFTEKNERVSYFIHEIGKIFGGKLEGRCVWCASYAVLISFSFYRYVYFKKLRFCWALLIVSEAINRFWKRQCSKCSVKSTRMNNADEGYKKFPDEVLLNILSYVTQDNFLNVRLVNRQWNKVSYDVSLWRKVSLQQATFKVDTIFADNSKDSM